MNAFYVKPRVANNKFGIKHYAGEVSFPYFLINSLSTFSVTNVVFLVPKEFKCA